MIFLKTNGQINFHALLQNLVFYLKRVGHSFHKIAEVLCYVFSLEEDGLTDHGIYENAKFEDLLF